MEGHGISNSGVVKQHDGQEFCMSVVVHCVRVKRKELAKLNTGQVVYSIW